MKPLDSRISGDFKMTTSGITAFESVLPELRAGFAETFGAAQIHAHWGNGLHENSPRRVFVQQNIADYPPRDSFVFCCSPIGQNLIQIKKSRPVQRIGFAATVRLDSV